ncbi:uncharacterized protein LOC110691367 [Chenopodium quinoa]|uniref:uncharacterized protein LOC110691367 n=1 Tax=Chenopodium quinoa TaxID=63459 RepID=UPI000B78961D|nr:uncharacterized protein LOC110691367 [Chenopodium quinoa]
MAEEIIAKCSNLRIDDDDVGIVDLGGVKSTEQANNFDLLLIGKVLTDRPYNVEDFRVTMKKSWALQNNLVIRVLGPNLYAFQFFHWRDKEKVLNGRPWCFDNMLLILKEIDGNEQPEQIPLTQSPFWIRLKNLPYNYRSNNDVKALVASLGDVIEIEDDLLGLVRSRRVKVMLDVTKPLRRSQRVLDKQGKEVRIEFAYERLPFFCFACGVMGHDERDCNVVSEESREQRLGWGKWLHASPRKGRIRDMEEIGEIVAAKKILFVTKNSDDEPVSETLSKQVEEPISKTLMGTEGVNNGELIVHTAPDGDRTEEQDSTVVNFTGTPGRDESGSGRNKKWKKVERATREYDSVMTEAHNTVELGERAREGGKVEKAIAKNQKLKEVSGLRDLIRREVPSVIFLSETKLSATEFNKVRTRIGDFEGLVVDSMGRSGGLAMLWRKGIDIVLRSMSVHHIDVEVRDGLRDMVWRLTGFYGWPEIQNRVLSWKLLEDLASQSQLTWVCLGDFNEILFSAEKLGKNDRAEWQMENFRRALAVCRLRDVPYSGYKYTYDNGREGGENTQCRLDRALVIEDWMTCFPDAHLFHLDRDWSDHAPIKLELGTRMKERPREKPFRFEQIWQSNETCESVIENAWLGGFNLESKLEMCASDLKEWSMKKFGEVFKELSKKRKQLNKLNKGGLTAAQLEKRRWLVRDIANLVQHEEIYWRQRSRVLRLESGDKNTRFFHQRESGGKDKNTVRKLVDDEGVAQLGEDNISKVAVSYFKNMFSTSNPPLIMQAVQDFQSRVTVDMNKILQAEYTEDEVKCALDQMHPIKAPGPDGMCPLFLQSYWNIVSPSISSTVLSILRGMPMPSYLNKTFIALIPKKKNAESMADFRPISLCNVAYKLVSKVEGSMAMKLDMSKAYDRIEWSFLEVVLERFGFDQRWRECVMDCVKFVSFFVLVNGKPTEEFIPSRGIRKGDPISPYLFILCAEIFSHLLRQAEERGSLRGVRIAPLAPSINHLLFADDCIIFSRASLIDVSAIQDVLSLYEGSSGQKGNFDKTTVSFSKGVAQGRCVDLASKLGVKLVDMHDRYLGLPTVVGRSKKVITKGVKEKLWKKLQGWKGMVLSKAGREVMIKAVAQYLPTYEMSVFKFPSSFCDEIRSLVAQFWWGQKQGERKIHWLAWRKLCRPKSEGGLGFRDFKMFNWSLLGKQAWRLIMKPNSLLEQVLKGKYYPSSSFMEAELGNCPSYTWRGIWEARWVVKRGLRWRVGNRDSIRVWDDPWIPHTQSLRVLSSKGLNNSNLVVSDLIDPVRKCWDATTISATFLPIDQDRILSIPLSDRLPEDTLCWDLEKDGTYSNRSAYRTLFYDEWKQEEEATSSPRVIWKKIWNTNVLPRIKVFMWRACQNALPTRKGIGSRISGYDTTCYVCHQEVEDVLHAIKECALARDVWRCSNYRFVLSLKFRNVVDWWEYLLKEVDEVDVEIMFTICWAIWGARNSFVIEGTQPDPMSIIAYALKVCGEVRDVRDNEGKGVISKVVQHAERWSKPSEGWVKMNVDAGVLGEAGTGLGAIARDSNGVVLCADVHQLARDRAIKRVVLESDSLLVVQALRGASAGRSTFHLLIEDITNVAASFDVVKWSFVRRNGNRVAHYLAHFQPWDLGQRMWVDHLPHDVIALAADDII